MRLHLKLEIGELIAPLSFIFTVDAGQQVLGVPGHLVDLPGQQADFIGTPLLGGDPHAMQSPSDMERTLEMIWLTGEHDLSGGVPNRKNVKMLEIIPMARITDTRDRESW